MTTRREFVSAVGLGVAAGAMLPTGALARLARFDGTLFDWKELAPGVHATHDMTSGGNVMVVGGKGGAMIVDTKFGPLSPILKREAESFGQPIRHVLNTHHHGDHTSGNVGFSGDAQIWAHEKARPRIEAQVDRYMRELGSGAGMLGRGEKEPEEWMLEAAQKMADRRETFEAGDWTPGRMISEGPVIIEFFETAVEVRHVGPGHTDNDVFVKVPDKNVVHAGDLFFNEMHPYFDPDGGGSSKGWIASLEGVIRICDERTQVIPGHGPLSDKAGLEKAKAYHEQLRDAVGAAIDEGKTKEEAMEMRWDFMEGLARDQLRPRAISFVYEEMKAEQE